MSYTRPWTSDEDERGKELWAQTQSVRKVAEALGRSAEAVSQRKVRVWGIKRSPKGPKTRTDLFDTWTPVSAYVLGFLVSDGHLRRNLRDVSLGQSHETGRQHLLKIQERTGGSLYYQKSTDSWSLHLMRKRLASRAAALGVPPGDKSRIVRWPSVPREYLDHFVRGIYDGDGSISGSIGHAGNLLITTTFTSGSPDFLRDLRSVLGREIGVSAEQELCQTGEHTWDLSYSLGDSLTLLDWLYARDKDSIVLDWKREAYQQLKAGRLASVSSGIKAFNRAGVVAEGGYPETPSNYSAFSPNLAEAVVRTFAEPDDLVLDPFAGWGTRAEACLRLGRRYAGYEIAPGAAQRLVEWLSRVRGRERDRWSVSCADGCVLADTSDESVDLVFTCPPYWNLERYESASGQLSDLPNYETFVAAMGVFARNVFRCLRPGKACVLVVGSVRRGDQFYPIVNDVFTALRGAGLEPADHFGLEKSTKLSLAPAKNAELRRVDLSREELVAFRRPLAPSDAPLPAEYPDSAEQMRRLSSEINKRVSRQNIREDTKQEVVRLFNADLTWREISEATGLTHSQLMRLRKDLGLPRRSPGGRGRGGGTSEGAKKRWAKPGAREDAAERMRDRWSKKKRR